MTDSYIGMSNALAEASRARQGPHPGAYTTAAWLAISKNPNHPHYKFAKAEMSTRTLQGWGAPVTQQQMDKRAKNIKTQETRRDTKYAEGGKENVKKASGAERQRRIYTLNDPRSIQEAYPGKPSSSKMPKTPGHDLHHTYTAIAHAFQIFDGATPQQAQLLWDHAKALKLPLGNSLRNLIELPQRLHQAGFMKGVLDVHARLKLEGITGREYVPKFGATFDQRVRGLEAMAKDAITSDHWSRKAFMSQFMIGGLPEEGFPGYRTIEERQQSALNVKKSTGKVIPGQPKDKSGKPYGPINHKGNLIYAIVGERPSSLHEPGASTLTKEEAIQRKELRQKKDDRMKVHRQERGSKYFNPLVDPEQAKLHDRAAGKNAVRFGEHPQSKLTKRQIQANKSKTGLLQKLGGGVDIDQGIPDPSTPTSLGKVLSGVVDDSMPIPGLGHWSKV